MGLMVLVFMVLGLLALALGVPGDFRELSRPAMLFAGLIWLGSGGATLFAYIRRTQPSTLEAE